MFCGGLTCRQSVAVTGSVVVRPDVYLPNTIELVRYVTHGYLTRNHPYDCDAEN